MPKVWEWGGDNCAHILALLFHTVGLGLLCAKTSNIYGTIISCGYNAMETLHFMAKNPIIFQKIENIWFLLRGIILWSLQIKRNNFIFNNEK